MNTLLTFLTATGIAFVCSAVFIALVSLPRYLPRPRPTDAERTAARRETAAYLRSTRYQTGAARLRADIHKGEQ